MNPENPSKDQVSDIELAQTLKRVRAVSYPEQYERISQDLLPDGKAEQIISKIAALSEEDDFALLCRMMNTTTHIVPLVQTPIIPSDSIVPDFLVRFQPGLWVDGKTADDNEGFSCFVDVKSTSKLKWRLGGSLLKRRRNFAEVFGFPLLFAIRFTKFAGNAYWVIVHDHDWSKSSLSASVEDLFSGIQHVLFDEYWYLIAPGTTFECVFAHEELDVAMHHHTYGSLKKFRILMSDQVIEFEGAEASLWSALFEPYRLEEVETRSRGNEIVQTLKPGVAACSIIDLVYCFNALPTDASGTRSFDPTRNIARVDTDPKAMLIADRKEIEVGVHRMQSSGVLLLMGVSSVGEHRDLWAKYGGRG